MCNSSNSQLTRPVASRNRMWTWLGLPMSRRQGCQHPGSLACSARGPELNWRVSLMWAGPALRTGQAGPCCLWHRCDVRPGGEGWPGTHWAGCPPATRCRPLCTVFRPQKPGEKGVCRDRYYLVVFRKYFDEDSTSCRAASHHFKLDCELSSLRGYSRSFVQNLSAAQTPEISSWLLVNIWMPGKSNLVSIWIVHSNNPSVHGRPLLITSTFESFHVFRYFICWILYTIKFSSQLTRIYDQDWIINWRNSSWKWTKNWISALRVNPVISTESTHQNRMDGVTYYLVIFASLANHFSCRSRKMGKNI